MSQTAAQHLKACKVCGDAFRPAMPLARVCSLACARRVPVLARKAAKQDKRETKARLDELKPLGFWQKQAQEAFNAWIRLRDAHLPCISCGSRTATSWDAGHYLTTGARPELRFDEANVHRQCVQCNQHLHGNLIRYRVGLTLRVGLAEVERLEGPHPPRKLAADALKAIRDDYRARAKVLKALLERDRPT